MSGFFVLSALKYLGPVTFFLFMQNPVVTFIPGGIGAKGSQSDGVTGCQTGGANLYTDKQSQ